MKNNISDFYVAMNGQLYYKPKPHTPITGVIHVPVPYAGDYYFLHSNYNSANN